MNNRQKAGVGMLVSGAVSALIGVLVLNVGVTPAWVEIGLQILTFIAGAVGIVVNLPSNTNPQ